MSFPSLLNEYWTVENVACTPRSRRTRTQLALEGSSESCALCPACTKPALPLRLERPRATSKSSLNTGCLGTRDKAEEISFCSSADGVHTFRTFTLTCGCCWADSRAVAATMAAKARKDLGSTRVILNDGGEQMKL